jgi:thymidylate kinase
MKIISISGLDGSGKSTQTALLKSYLENQGKKVFYFHAIQFGMAQKLSRGPSSTQSITKATWFQIIARRIFLFLDLMRFKRLLKKLTQENYDFLVSDRYFYDSIINIYYLAKNKHKIPCENFIPKTTLSVYLKVFPESIMQRERKPDQGIDYLQDKKILYDDMAPVWDLKIINGNKPPEEIFEEIRKLI